MNKRRLGAIARWLEADAPHKKNVLAFNMRFGVFYKERKDTPQEMLTCGTICCIAGAAVQFFNDPVKFAENEMTDGFHLWGGLDADWHHVETEARKLLELTDDQSEALFVPQYDSLRCERSRITSAWAARCIRKLIKTGEVDWKGTKERAI